MRLVGMIALTRPDDRAVVNTCLCKLAGIEETPKHATTEERAHVHTFARAVVESYVEYVWLNNLYVGYV